MRRSGPISAILLGVVLLAAGCGGAPATGGASPASAAPSSATSAAPSSAAAGSSTPAASKPLTPVTLRLDWLIGGYDAPYALAQADGFYRQAGLKVNIEEGKGSATTVETVANGSDTFGSADSSTAALLISKGTPVTVLAVFLQQSPFSFIHNPNVQLNSPKDLIGKTIITTAGGASWLLLPALLSPAGVSINQLHADMTSPTAYAQAFIHNPNSIVLGWSNTDFQRLQLVDPKAVDTPYSKFGFDLYSIGLLADNTLIKDHPGEVGRFVAATVKGWQAAIKDPQAAVDATLKEFSDAKRGPIASGLQVSLKMLHTPATQGKPIGWMASSDWRTSINALKRYLGLKGNLPLSHYYTNRFIPGGAG